MSKGHFTSSGHFIVLRGVQEGKILVADPASYTRSQQSWDLSMRGHHNGHGGGAAAIAADVVRAVGFIGPAFVQLIEIDHLRGPISERSEFCTLFTKSSKILGPVFLKNCA